MAVGDVRVFPGCLTPVLTQLFFPKPPTIFLTCFSRGERPKYARKKFRLNRVYPFGECTTIFIEFEKFRLQNQGLFGKGFRTDMCIVVIA